jgi:hypothetical protein
LFLAYDFPFNCGIRVENRSARYLTTLATKSAAR